MNLDSSGTDNTLVIPGINIDSVEKIDSREKILSVLERTVRASYAYPAPGGHSSSSATDTGCRSPISIAECSTCCVIRAIYRMLAYSVFGAVFLVVPGLVEPPAACSCSPTVYSGSSTAFLGVCGVYGAVPVAFQDLYG